MGWIDRYGCWQPGPEDYSGVTFTPTAPVNYVAAECPRCILLRAENERLRKALELGVEECRHRRVREYDTCEDNCGVGYRHQESCPIYLPTVQPTETRGEP